MTGGNFLVLPLLNLMKEQIINWLEDKIKDI